MQYNHKPDGTFEPLKKKNVDLNSEMTKHLDLLYNRYVPLQVKEFFSMKNNDAKTIKNKQGDKK